MVIVTIDGDGQNDPARHPQAARRPRSTRNSRSCPDDASTARKMTRCACGRRSWPTRSSPAGTGSAGARLRLRPEGVSAARAVKDIHLPRGMNRFLPAILGVPRDGRSSKWQRQIALAVTGSHTMASGTPSSSCAICLPYPSFFYNPQAYRDCLLRSPPPGSPALAAAYGGLRCGLLTIGCDLTRAPCCGLIWWNVRRFNRTQSNGAYRLRPIRHVSPHRIDWSGLLGRATAADGRLRRCRGCATSPMPMPRACTSWRRRCVHASSIADLSRRSHPRRHYDRDTARHPLRAGTRRVLRARQTLLGREAVGAARSTRRPGLGRPGTGRSSASFSSTKHSCTIRSSSRRAIGSSMVASGGSTTTRSNDLSMGRIRRDSDIWWNAAPHDLALLRLLAPSRVASIRVEPVCLCATRRRRHLHGDGAARVVAPRRIST